jgi:anti-anti-sigma factor
LERRCDDDVRDFDASSDQLKVEVRGDDAGVTVVLEGELDLASVGAFTSAVDEALDGQATTITLDWSGLSFIDSSGVGAYVQVFRRARTAGTTLVLGPRSSVVQRVLDLSGVEDALGDEAASG